jgi:hypothetical protein
MKIKKEKIVRTSLIFIAVFALAFLLGSTVIEAAPFQITNPLGPGSATVGDIVDKIIDFLLQVGIPLAVLMYVWAGFMFLTSSGNEIKVKKARQAIIWTTIGLAVLIVGKGFVYVVEEILTV